MYSTTATETRNNKNVIHAPSRCSYRQRPHIRERRTGNALPIRAKLNKRNVNITEALKILQQVPASAPAFPVDLICGFTPLHVQTLFAAYLQRNLPDRRTAVTIGLYGDVPGSLESRRDSTSGAIAIILEWQDLDARLGYRGSGRWGPSQAPDIVNVARTMLDRIASAIEGLPSGIPVACCLPTLPLPPLFHTPGWQAAEAELTLIADVSQFASRIVRRKALSLVNAGYLSEESPPAGRFDLKSDLASGMPYTLLHANAVAGALARLVSPTPAKKGLITDLDDTLWHGLVGEVGPENVTWDLESRQQLHGLYQKTLAALAEEGVLVGIASKNDPAIAAQALNRPDILLPANRVFPIEVHWEAKSGSVARILQTWNISADSVVFVDDSSMESAEVSMTHPGIECLLFPKNDANGVLALLRRLRDLFGRPRILGEDALRLESIRQGEAFRDLGSVPSRAEDFLKQTDATVVLDFDLSQPDPRALELVNKTNQFNLNGVRYLEADWVRRLGEPGAMLLVVSYQDKFGQLGKIAALQGRDEGETLYVDSWVMSCRAFSRRIEYQCLKALFERHNARQIAFGFSPTAKNGPLQEFFANVLESRPTGPFLLTRAQFEQNCPPLYHRVVSERGVLSNG